MKPSYPGREQRYYAKNTWTETVGPWQVFTRARALCPDGKLRIVKLAICADTYFSVPARLSYKGKTVCGCIGFNSESGLSPDPDQHVTFYAHGKHANIFARSALKHAFRKALCKSLGVSEEIPDGVLADLAEDKLNLA